MCYQSKFWRTKSTKKLRAPGYAPWNMVLTRLSPFCVTTQKLVALLGEPKKLASVGVPPPWGGDVADPVKAHPCRCVLPRRIWSFYVKGCGPEVSPKNWGAPPAAWAPPVASGRASPSQTRHFDPHIGYHAEFDRC